MRSWLKQLIFPSTAQQSVNFPFEVIKTQALGEVRRPTVKVKIWSDVLENWHNVPMLIDTGADYSLLPKYMGSLFTTKRSKENQRTTVGIGGDEMVYFIEKVKIKVGPFERLVPVGIATSNKIPPLMGRHLFFETFVTTFNKNQQIIFNQ